MKAYKVLMDSGWSAQAGRGGSRGRCRQSWEGICDMGQGSEPTPQLGKLEEALSKNHRTLDSGRDSGMSSPCLTQGTYPQGFLLVGGRARMLRKPSGSSILESLEHPSSCSSKSKVFLPSVGKSPRCKRSALSPKSPRGQPTPPHRARLDM